MLKKSKEIDLSLAEWQEMLDNSPDKDHLHAEVERLRVEIHEKTLANIVIKEFMVATELERKIRFKDFTAPNTSKPDIRVQFVVYELEGNPAKVVRRLWLTVPPIPVEFNRSRSLPSRGIQGPTSTRHDWGHAGSYNDAGIDEGRGEEDLEEESAEEDIEDEDMEMEEDIEDEDMEMEDDGEPMDVEPMDIEPMDIEQSSVQQGRSEQKVATFMNLVFRPRV